MDRLTQLQDAIEDVSLSPSPSLRPQLFTIASSTLSYLTTKPSFRPLHPDLPVTFKAPSSDPLPIVVETERELLADLVRKAKQVEHLVGVLPAKETDGGRAHADRVGKLQAELEVVDGEFEQAVKEAGALPLPLLPPDAGSVG